MKKSYELSKDDIRIAISEYVEKHAGYRPKEIHINISPEYNQYDQRTGGYNFTARVTE